MLFKLNQLYSYHISFVIFFLVNLAIAFSIFQYLVYVWQKLFLQTYFTIQFIFITIHVSHYIF